MLVPRGKEGLEMKKRKVSLTLEGDLIVEVDRIVMKRREQEYDDRVLKVVSRSQVIEDLVRSGLEKLKVGKQK